MRYTVYKLFFAWNFEKEEKWLNKMSAKGMQLIDIGFCRYTFEEGGKGEYSYRIELLDNLPVHPESISYIRFLEDTGVEHVGSFMRWCYFRRKAADGEFEIYSDYDSRIRHYKRVLFLFLAMLPMNIANMISMLHNYLNHGYMSQLVIAILCGILTTLLANGIIRMSRRIHTLKKEKVIRE